MNAKHTPTLSRRAAQEWFDAVAADPRVRASMAAALRDLLAAARKIDADTRPLAATPSGGE